MCFVVDTPFWIWQIHLSVYFLCFCVESLSDCEDLLLPVCLLTLSFLFQWLWVDRCCLPPALHKPIHRHTHTHAFSLSALISTSPPFFLSPRHPSFPLAVGLTGYTLSMLLGHGGPDSSDFCHSELALPPSSHLLTATPNPPPTLYKCSGLWLTPTHSLTLQRHIADSPVDSGSLDGVHFSKGGPVAADAECAGRWMQETEGECNV